MFSLVITIISIALVAALALATLFYGGAAMHSSSDRTAAVRSVSEGGQVRGALELYRADHSTLPTGTSPQIADILVAKNYLKAMPVGDNWAFQTGRAVQSGLTQAQCEQINVTRGLPATVPACADLAEDLAACCSTA